MQEQLAELKVVCPDKKPKATGGSEGSDALMAAAEQLEAVEVCTS